MFTLKLTGTWQDTATSKKEPLRMSRWNCSCLNRSAGHLDDESDKTLSRLPSWDRRGTLGIELRGSLPVP